jgi:tellurite methyltransferase
VTEFTPDQDPGPGGYDASYRQCPCFWGNEPGRIVQLLADSVDLAGAHVLDLGCGEGKNAAFLASRGCSVEAWDISEAALANAKAIWPHAPVKWVQKDVSSIEAQGNKFDLVIAYGLYHCLAPNVIFQTIANVKKLTASGGYNIAVCYNNRMHLNMDIAHPGFDPTYLAHEEYLSAYGSWPVLYATDENLIERHPTNMIEHTHSMTRLLVQNRMDH